MENSLHNIECQFKVNNNYKFTLNTIEKSSDQYS